MAEVTILYFARVREVLGTDAERLEIPVTVSTPRSLAAWLSSRSERHAAAFSDPEALRCAIDQTMTSLDAPLGQPREIAFFPPVTGG